MIHKIQGHPVLNSAWTKLLKQLPKAYHKLTLNISPHDVKGYELTKGAWAISGQVTIGEKFLNKFYEDELALVTILSHELGHHILGHTHSYNDVHEEELDADQVGLFIAIKAGYDRTQYVNKCIEFEKWRSKGLIKHNKKSKTTSKLTFERLAGQVDYLRALEEDD